MKSQSSEFSLPKFAHHLSALTRERIDITALSVGSSVARSSAKVVFWSLLAFLFFFLFLALNMALGFALGTWMGGSPAVGFLYLAVGYLGLILLVVLLRPWITRQVRDHVSRRALAETQRLNTRLDLIPYLRRQRYNSPSRAIHQRGSYLILEQARYQTLLLQDETFPEVIRGATYLRDHGPEILASYARAEAINYASTLPIIGSLLDKLGYKPSRRLTFSESKEGESRNGKFGKFSKYTPYLMTAWELVAPALVSIAASKAKGFLSSLFFRKAKKNKRNSWR
ncbi:hypothetical protein [Porphyromonas sp.]